MCGACSRHRGKSPRQAAFFFSNPELNFQAAQLASLFVMYGLLCGTDGGLEPRYRLGSLESGALLCQAYEAYLELHAPAGISFEHAWFLLLALARRDEVGISRCAVCGGVRLRDLLAKHKLTCGTCGPVIPRPPPARIRRMQQRNIFAGPYLDRAAHLRQDPEWFAAALADERSRAIPVWNSRNLIAEGDAPRAVYLELSRIPAEQRNSDGPDIAGPIRRYEFLRLRSRIDRAAVAAERRPFRGPAHRGRVAADRRSRLVGLRARHHLLAAAASVLRHSAARRRCPRKAAMCWCAATPRAAMNSSRASIRPSSCWSATASVRSWDAKRVGP